MTSEVIPIAKRTWRREREDAAPSALPVPASLRRSHVLYRIHDRSRAAAGRASRGPRRPLHARPRADAPRGALARGDAGIRAPAGAPAQAAAARDQAPVGTRL